MKISMVSLLLASSVCTAGQTAQPNKAPDDNGASVCKLSNIVSDLPLPVDRYQRTASACIQDIRQAAQGFSHTAANIIHDFEPALEQSQKNLLGKVDLFYQCRSNEFDLNQHLEKVQSTDAQARDEHQRIVSQNDSEIGFVHDRFVHPLVENVEARGVKKESEALLKQSQHIKNAHQVYALALDRIAHEAVI